MQIERTSRRSSRPRTQRLTTMPSRTSRTRLVEIFPSNAFSSSIPFNFFRLPTLDLSCSFFRRSHPLFSMLCTLFDKNTRVAYPPQGTATLSRVPKAQKRPPVSPFPASLTHSLSRISFACHSYANTRDVCPPAALNLFFSSLCDSVPRWQTAFSIYL
jgi:hypothetical protein